MFKLSSKFKGSAFVDTFSYLCFLLVFVTLSCLVVTCWERADLLALLCVMFSCFVNFSYGILAQLILDCIDS